MKYVSVALMGVLAIQGCDMNATLDTNLQASLMAEGLDEGTSMEPECDNAGSPFGGGSGTAEDPYLICSVDQLKRIRETGGISYHAMYYLLMSDLDLSSEANWSPLPQFFGSFDGQNHTISNLKITSGGDKGLFTNLSYTSGYPGTIKNLNFTNAQITGTSQLGVLAGSTHVSSTIENVHVLSGSISGTTQVGGVVGFNDGKVHYSTSLASVTASSFNAGGIVGANDGIVEYSDANGAVTISAGGTQNTKGRIVGYNGFRLRYCTYPDFTHGAMAPYGVNDSVVTDCN